MKGIGCMAENINISPDMINNIVNMLKENVSSSNNTTNDIMHSDTSECHHSSENNNYNENEASSNNDAGCSDSSIDFETIMKVKSIMETMNNKDDPNANLLYSLKPYLRKSKQEKLEQYINLLKISQVTKLFKNEKGDAK